MTQRRGPREFLAGVLAAVVMTVAMLALRLTSDVLSLPELLGEGFIRVLPAAIFSKILDLMQHAAKPVLEVGILLGQLAVAGLVGRLYGREPGWSRAATIVAAIWLAVGLVLLPLVGLGLFGSGLRVGAVAIAASLAAVFAIFAASLVWFYQLLLPSPAVQAPASHDLVSRRSVFAKLGLGVATLAVGGYGWRAVTGAAPRALAPAAPAAPEAPAAPAGGTGSSPGSASSTPGRTATAVAQPASVDFLPRPGAPADGAFAVQGLSPEVTPTKDFYTISKNFFDPSVDVRGWSLTVEGLVERPTTFDYEGIKQLPAKSDFYTLQCISNEVGGDLWGNAYWKGVRLLDLLQQVGLKPGIRKVVFHAADDYTDSIVLDRALNAGTLLAYEMNGAPLEKSHGYPARLLIPGIFGMKNVKWVTRIELVDYDFKGYWMQRGWSDPAPYKTSSRIDAPSNRSTPRAGEVPIGGVAFAGDRGIRTVEYSLDDGQTWQPAELKPPLATNTWQLWVASPTLKPGSYTVKVRATDGKGDLQTEKRADPLPDGATGHHAVIVAVA